MDKQDEIITLLQQQNKLLKEQNLRMAQLQEILYNAFSSRMPRRVEGLHYKHKTELQNLFK
ncbi:MAG: hypothetical protein IKB21_00190 [Clostridia bacterium]|nr:hypothetical protein [Clostridia bacterium]MBR2433011.1 hypothetical protein [Clostridia bacterium]